MWNKLPWLLIALVIAIVLTMAAVATWLLQQKNSQLTENRPDGTLLQEQEEKSCGLPSAESVAANKTVAITGIGFDAEEVAIKVGQTVRWVNSGSNPHRVVVGPHPLHNSCLGLDTKSLGPNESFGFTFTKPGEWIVHDEMQLTNKSKIIVTE